MESSGINNSVLEPKKLSHKLWRKQAKKERRQKIRQERADKINKLLKLEQEAEQQDPSYQKWLEKQAELDRFIEEEKERQRDKDEKEWHERERIAQEKWKEKLLREENILKERKDQERRIREEWEEQQKREKKEREERERKEQQRMEKQEALLKELADYLAGDASVPPSMCLMPEVEPGRDVCPFFSKTGVCRFGDRCSRCHPRPILSRTLLFPGFYSNFLMDQSLCDEYDTDLSLEYEDSEMYHHFRDFYDDIVTELEKAGRIVQLKVCCNCEVHLRGNVYVQFRHEREAVKAFQMFNGRWYGGKQLSIEFVNIPSWRAALCGLFNHRRCPKGRGCNFIHAFRNPRNEYCEADRDFERPFNRHGRRRSRSRSPHKRSHRRSSREGHSSHWSETDRTPSGRDTPSQWRWSISPERARGTSNHLTRCERKDKTTSSHHIRSDFAGKTSRSSREREKKRSSKTKTSPEEERMKKRKARSNEQRLENGNKIPSTQTSK